MRRITAHVVLGDSNSPGDWSASGTAVPFTPVAKHLPEESSKWQELFERSFARELSCRHESAEAFLSHLHTLEVNSV